MKSLGWIKLHRKLLENTIFTSEKGLKIWIWCLLKANHDDNEIFVNMQKLTIKSGQFVFGRESASKELRMSPSTVRNWLELLKKDSYLDIKPNNKYSLITILKYADYQEVDSKKDNRITTEKQQNNTNKNDKNDKNEEIVSKDTMVKDRDEMIDFILDEFKKRFGAYPIDRKPRQVAHNVRQIATTFLKKYGDGYEKLRGTKLDLKSTILRAYDVYQQKESSQNVEYLDTFKRHMKKIFELTVSQMIKDGIIIS